MKRSILFVILLLFILVNYIHGRDTSFFLNQDISRIHIYRDGVLRTRRDYETEGRTTTVYFTDVQSMRTHINKVFTVDENLIEVNMYFNDGSLHSNRKMTFSDDGLLISEESRTNFPFGEEVEVDRWFYFKAEYFYDANSNLIRSVTRRGNEFERRYTYLYGDLVLIEENMRPIGGSISSTRTERVERIDGKIVHTPAYNFDRRMDRKVIENIVEGEVRITTITYYLNDEVFERRRYIFRNERIESVMVYRRMERGVSETKFFYEN